MSKKKKNRGMNEPTRVAENLQGLYIVTLNNRELISVNRNDKRVADKAIKVNRQNCKVGKAMDFKNRERNYVRVFGEPNVNFYRIAGVGNAEELDKAEKMILDKLKPFRIKGRTGRLNEWLQGISPNEVERIMIDTLSESGVDYKLEV